MKFLEHLKPPKRSRTGIMLAGALAVAVAILIFHGVRVRGRTPEKFSAPASNVLQRTAFIAFCTPNYKALTDVWRASLLAAGVPPRNVFLTEAHIPEKYANNVSGEAKFRTDVWHWCLREKISVAIRTLRKIGTSGFQFLAFSDCDIQFFPGRLRAWEQTLGSFARDPTKEIMFLAENGSAAEVNSGFYIMKAGYAPHMAAFLTWVLRELEKPGAQTKYPLGDQTLVNTQRHLLKYTSFPAKNVVWGPHVPAQTSDVLFHHAVAAKHNGKLNQMEEVRRKVLGL